MRREPTRLSAARTLAARLFAGACFFALFQSARAQDDGPIIVGVQRELEPFKLEDFKFALDLVGQHRTGRVKPAAGPTLRETETIFRETMTIISSGYIGHPNLVELDLAGTFGLSQESLDSDLLGAAGDNQHERTVETIFEYDVKALILRESSTPTTLYSNRSQTLINRQFGESIDSIVTVVGARAVLRSDTLPTSLHYFHREEEQTSRSGNVSFDLVQDTFEWSSQYQPDENQLLSWDYAFDNIEQAGLLRTPQTFQRHNAHLAHSLDFGPANEHNLRSSLQAYHEEGDFPFDRVRWEEMLRLRHNRKFQTHYNYTLEWQQRPAEDQVFHQGRAGFRHELFESLVTSGDLSANYLSVSPGNYSSYQTAGHLRFDYHKQVPLGRLSAGTFVTLSQQTSSEQGAGFVILDEAHAFGPAGIITLNRRNVDPASLHVTDAAGLILFSPGIDYIATSFGNRVEIRRVLGGSIADDEAVLIDYQVGPEPGHTLTTLGTGASVRYDIDEGLLKGLGAYARIFHQEQELSDGDVTPSMLFIDTVVDDFTFGADYRVGNLFFGAERQDRDSTFSPFTTTRFDARYVQPLGYRSSLTIHASQLEIDRHAENLRTEITVIGSRWSQSVTDRLSMNLSVLWRHEVDNVSLDVQGFEQQLDFNWRYRQTSVYGAVRNAILESNTSDSSFQTFMLGLRREF